MNKESTHCKHFVKRKKRFCRMTVKSGQEYCGEHTPITTDKSNQGTTNTGLAISGSQGSIKLRIKCPLDPKHTCFASKLAKHLKICNARQAAPLPYIVKGVNCQDYDTENCENQTGTSLEAVPSLKKRLKIDTESNLDTEVNIETQSNLEGQSNLERQSNLEAQSNLKTQSTLDSEPIIESNSATQSTIETRLLSNATIKKMQHVIAQVNKIYTDLIKNKITTKILQSSVVEEELLKPEYGNRTKKHLVQASSIVGLLENYNLLQTDTCFVEFGAGKGMLSYWISKSINNIENSSVLLIERAAHRHKLDNKLDKTSGNVHRIRADIGDLVLNKVDIVHDSKGLVGVTKHLCGEATDLALRCLANFVKMGGNLSGVILAFCCHHRCQWPSYVGKQFFRDMGLEKEDFDIMCGMVSWATCGTGAGRDMMSEFVNMGNNDVKDNTDENYIEDVKNEKKNNDSKHCVGKDTLIELNARDQELGLNRVEKAEVGKKCKYILNWGRLTYLEHLKFKCNLHFYVETDVTPENLCIVAVRG